MTSDGMNGPASERGGAWKWWVCGLLLLATMINYMDRLTLNLLAQEIKTAFKLDNRDYGQLESVFAIAFAIGAIVAGWMVDRWSVYWIYPIAVLAWSLAGFATGLAAGFLSLLVCRFFLGLAESGNWPCALRTTQRILPPKERALGNSILQSGAAIGAILTPSIVIGLMSLTGTWRWPFLVIGVLGAGWVVLWFRIVRRESLLVEQASVSPSLVNILALLIPLYGFDFWLHERVKYHADWEQIAPFVWFPEAVRPHLPLWNKIVATFLGIGSVMGWLLRATRDDTSLPRRVFLRRYLVLAILVVAINVTWHYFRVWMPLFLRETHHYNLNETGWFTTAYYVAADVGSLTAGFVALYLARRGLSVHGSRLIVFALGAGLCLLSLVVAHLPAGWLLLGLLLVIGFAALAVFPMYYSFSQELTVRHQGKLTGSLGCVCWLSMALLHELVGDASQRTGEYAQGIALAGMAPLVGLFVLLLLWGSTPAARQEE
jgi:ACS family hexuronate transporter-like MFS transporter